MVALDRSIRYSTVIFLESRFLRICIHLSQNFPRRGKRTFCAKRAASTEEPILCLLPICHLRMCRLLHSNRSPSRQVFTRPQKGSTFHSGRWWTAVSPGDELAEVEGQPVQPAREGGRGGEGRSGRGWPGEVSWAILPKAQAMQYHQKPEEKNPHCNYS